MLLKYIALATVPAQQLRAGKADANGQPAEIAVSDGDGNHCRHCLAEIAAGENMLILAHRPFTTRQPYAEVGPIFLCRHDCRRYPEANGIPEMYRQREMLIRGYDRDERIVYGTGKVIDMVDIEIEADRLFAKHDLASIHACSTTNNCYHFRVER